MSRQFTFIHTGDLHLDAPFKGIDAEDPRVRTTLVESTYAAFDRIVSLAIEREVDFIVVAGDVYNSRDKSLRSQLRFAAAAERLAGADIPVYVAHGNHDPADGWSANITLPETVHHFSTASVERAEVHGTDDVRLCTLYGRGYATAAITEDLAAGFARAEGDETAIGVLHANVGGQPGHQPYAPTTLDVLKAARMDYWALGHIHKRMDLLDVPRIRYCGSPQGLDPNEDGPHGCWVVTMERGTVIAEEFVETAEVRWARAVLDASGLDGLDGLRDGVNRLCDEHRSEGGGVPVIVRADLVGRSGVHSDIALEERLEDLVADVRRTQMGLTPWVWLARVRDRTSPALDIDSYRDAPDFIGDLVRISDGLLDDPGAASLFVNEALAGVDSAFGSRERDAVELLERARDMCLDRLLGEAGS